MDRLKQFRPDISLILKRSFHRSEYASGLSSLLIIFTLIILIRFMANMYLFLSLHTAGEADLHMRQIWGGLLFSAVYYVIAGAFIQGYKINRLLSPLTAVFHTALGRRLFYRLKVRVLVYRPLMFGIFAILVGFAVVLSILYRGEEVWFVWLYFIIAAGLAVGGYWAVSILSVRLLLEEFESRLMEVLFLSVLVFSNPDFLTTVNGLELGFFLIPPPFGSLSLWFAGIFASLLSAAILVVLFRIGSTIFAVSTGGRAGTAVSSLPLSLKLYGKILKPRYWLVLCTVAVLVTVNQHLQVRQKLLTVFGISGTALLTFTIFLFYIDTRIRGAWHISSLNREHISLYILPFLMHLLLSAIPYLLYCVIG